MNKLIIPAAAVLLAVGAGSGAWVYTHRGTPLENGRALQAKGDLRGAQIELRNAVREEPNNAEAHFRLAQLQLQGGDPIAAERELRAARDLGYDADVVTPLLGQAMLAQRRFDDVLAQVPATASKLEATAVNLVIRSLAQISLQKLAEAKAGLAEAQRLAPQNVDAVATSARLALLQNDLPEASAQVERALAIEPNRADSLMLKGQVLAAKGDRTGALDALDKAVAAAPAGLPLRLERAGQELQAGQDTKARADVDYVLSKDNRIPMASYLDLVLLVRAGKFTEADAVLTKLEPVIARMPRGLYFEAIVKANLNQLETAADAAARYVARVPLDAEGVRLLARIEIANKRPERAVAALTSAVKAGVNDAETQDLLGRAYAVDGKAPLAAQSFQRASELAPDNAAILTRLASSKLQMGDTGGATTALERSLDMAPKQANAGEALVAAALATGDADKAQAALDRMRGQVGETEQVGILTGLVKLARRDLDGAHAAFADVAQRFPQSVTAPVNLAKVDYLQNKPAEAEATLRTVLARSPADPQALNTLVADLVRRDRAADAIALVRAARTATPANSALTAAIADLQIRSKDAPGALATLEEARTTAGGTLPTPLLPSQARAQAAAGDMDGAKTTLQRYIAATPADLEALRSYVELLINTKDYPAARQVLADSLRNSPGNLGMMQAMLLVENRTAGLPAALAKAEELRRNPANMPAAGVLKGDLLMAGQRYGDAASAFAEEMKAAPSTVLAMRQAAALVSGGGQEQASAVLRGWLAQHPDDMDATLMLAGLDINARRLQDAETRLQAVLAKRPNDPVALNNLAWVYQKRNNPEALVLARRAYLLAPSTESADTLGWLLVTTGDPKAGLPLLQQAVAGRGTDQTIRYHLAVALSDNGQQADAMKLLDSLIAEPASFEDKAAASKLLGDLKAKH